MSVFSATPVAWIGLGGVRVVSVAPLGAAQGKIHSGDILAAGIHQTRWVLMRFDDVFSRKLCLVLGFYNP